MSLIDSAQVHKQACHGIHPIQSVHEHLRHDRTNDDHLCAPSTVASGSRELADDHAAGSASTSASAAASATPSTDGHATNGPSLASETARPPFPLFGAHQFDLGLAPWPAVSKELDLSLIHI